MRRLTVINARSSTHKNVQHTTDSVCVEIDSAGRIFLACVARAQLTMTKLNAYQARTIAANLLEAVKLADDAKVST